MFRALQFFYDLVGNYGVSILIVTVLIKAVFFPLASRSYETMAKMKNCSRACCKSASNIKTTNRPNSRSL